MHCGLGNFFVEEELGFEVVKIVAGAVFCWVPLGYVLVEEISELGFRLLFQLEIRRVRISKLDKPLLCLCVRDDALEVRVVSDVGLPVCVRVSIASPFVT